MNKLHLFKLYKLTNGRFISNSGEDLGDTYSVYCRETEDSTQLITFDTIDITVESDTFTGSLLDYIKQEQRYSLIVDRKTNRGLKVLSYEIPTTEHFYSVPINLQTYEMFSSWPVDKLKTIYITTKFLGMSFRRDMIQNYRHLSLFTFGSEDPNTNIILNKLRFQALKKKLDSRCAEILHSNQLACIQGQYIPVSVVPKELEARVEARVGQFINKYNSILSEYLESKFNSSKSIEDLSDLLPTLYFGYCPSDKQTLIAKEQKELLYALL